MSPSSESLSAPKPTALRRASRVLRWIFLALAVFVVLAGAAYKHWIPGGDLVGDYVDLARNKLRVLGFRREADQIAAGSVVFLGSSTVASFPFDACYPGAPWLNRGVAAETVPELLERLDASLPVARPAGVVILAGHNDLRARARPTDEIVANIERTADKVLSRFPDVPITLVEILPLCDTDEPSRLRLDAVNSGLQRLASRRGFGFVHANRPPLTDGAGSLRVDMAGPDRKHVHAEGAKILGKIIADEGGAATAPLRARRK